MMCEGLRQASTFGPAAPHVSQPQAGDGSGMLYIGECNLAGGVFANRPIRKEEIILVFGGALIVSRRRSDVALAASTCHPASPDLPFKGCLIPLQPSWPPPRIN